MLSRIGQAMAVALAALVAAGCSVQFSVGTKKDLATGLSASWKGLSLEAAQLVVDGQALSSNEVELGKKAVIRLSGVGGFKARGDKVFPGASMLVTDAAGGTVLDVKDLFETKAQEGVSVGDAEVITLSLNTGDPMTKGAVYHWVARVWDKNGKGEINAKIDVKIK